MRASHGEWTKLIDLFHPTSQTTTTTTKDVLGHNARHTKYDFHFNLAILWLWWSYYYMHILCSSYFFQFFGDFFFQKSFSFIFPSFASWRALSLIWNVCIFDANNRVRKQASRERKKKNVIVKSKNHCKSSMQNNGQAYARSFHFTGRQNPECV